MTTTLPFRKRGLTPARLAAWPSLFDELSGIFETPTSVSSALNGFAIDVEELPDSYLVRANVPGVNKENIHLSLDGNDLTISVQQSDEREEKEKNYLYRERHWNTSQRTITLPLSSNTEEIDAKTDNGVLNIKIKKRPEKQARKIVVA